MKRISKLYADLGAAGWAVKWPDWQSEAGASRAVRAALGRMFRSKKARDRRAAQAVYARYFGIGEEGPRPLLARGLRRLRADPDVRRSVRAAEPDPTAKPFSVPTAGTGWIAVREAADLTGYSVDHVRSWVLGRVRRRKAGNRVYVNRAEMLSYARRMRARGYGPTADGSLL